MAFARSFIERVMPRPPRPAEDQQLHSAPYRVCLARSEEERRAAYRLRFRTFNLELNEGLERAYETGEDTDEFDRFCDHLIVHDDSTGCVVGTYRLQTGASAQRNLGYYSAREFDFTPYAALAHEMVELGRACIHPDHRKYEVLMLLWKAVSRYAVARGAHYLIGCSSITSQDPGIGGAMYESLKPMLAPEHLRTSPTAPYAFPMTETETSQPVRPPKLLRAYLAVGANICGPPALDREFKTIDFLTLIDLNTISPAIRRRLLGK
ncbi:MAG TPA: GNAT family N-acyltransferase [Candidatus Angelobacter sp.]|nr:GNAT family N-acyltransferase [Candidatus Angelobacter sp.]